MLKNNLKTNKRDYRIIVNFAQSILVRGIGVIISFFLVPVYMKYFDEKIILGFWFTLMSVLAWILSFDLGLGNGLRNRLVPYLVEENVGEIKKIISSAYVSISILVIFIVTIVIMMLPFIDLNAIFNVETKYISTEMMNMSFIIAFVGMMLNFVLKLSSSILYSLQEIAAVGISNLVSNLIIIISLVLYVPRTDSSKLLYLSVVYFIAMNLPQLALSVKVFSKKVIGGWPKLKYFDHKSASSLMKLSIVFFALQLAYLVMNSTNEFLISKLASPDKVVEYQIYNKIFMLFGSLLLLLAAPLWSAVSHAVAEKDYIWINSKYKQIIIISVSFSVMMVVMLPFLPNLIHLWLNIDYFEINFITMIAVLFMNILFVWNSMNSAFANGLNDLGPQIYSFSIGAVINIPLAIIFVTFLKSWLGVIVANILSLSIYAVVQPIYIFGKYIKEKHV